MNKDGAAKSFAVVYVEEPVRMGCFGYDYSDGRMKCTREKDEIGTEHFSDIGETERTDR